MSRTASGLLACFVIAAATLHAAPASKEFRRTVPLGTSGRVELRSQRGTARITSWDRQEVDVVATVEARPDTPNPEESVRRTEIHFEAALDNVFIQTDFGNRLSDAWSWDGRNSTPLVHYEIKVPRTVEFILNDDRSEIEIGDLAGRLQLRTDRTEVHIASFNGSLNVNTDRGTLRIDRLLLAKRGEFRTDRTEVELGVSATHGMTLDLDLDRVSPDVDTGLFSTQMAPERHHLSYRGSIGRGGPVLRYTADRGSLKVRRV